MQPITFSTSDGLTLEAELRHPDTAPRGSAVICHALPTQGGSKDHPLLWAIRNELAGRGFVVLTFNFRGVMGSEGTFEGGTAELADVAAAVARVREETPGPTLVAGWSFGAHVALRQVLVDGRVGALALVGLPLGVVGPPLPPLPDRAALGNYRRPVLLLAGEADQYCTVSDLRAFGRRLGDARVHILRGTDHFLWRREGEAARVIGRFADDTLSDGRTAVS